MWAARVLHCSLRYERDTKQMVISPLIGNFIGNTSPFTLSTLISYGGIRNSRLTANVGQMNLGPCWVPYSSVIDQKALQNFTSMFCVRSVTLFARSSGLKRYLRLWRTDVMARYIPVEIIEEISMIHDHWIPLMIEDHWSLNLKTIEFKNLKVEKVEVAKFLCRKISKLDKVKSEMMIIIHD